MRYAIIDVNNVVVNVIVADNTFITNLDGYFTYVRVDDLPIEPGIYWTYISETFASF